MARLDLPSGGPQLVASLNQRAALEVMLDGEALTRAALSERIGLSKVTASRLIDELVRRGLVVRTGTAGRRGRGPRAEQYGINRDLGYVIGIDFGPHHVLAAAADVTGAVRGRATRPIAEDDEPQLAILAAIRSAVQLADMPEASLRRVVLGTPGVVDPRTGEIAVARDIEDRPAGRRDATAVLAGGVPRWRQSLLSGLRAAIAGPVVFENDVNLAALAEAHAGVARGEADFVLLWADRGVGLGIVRGGELHRGSTGAAGELGYLPVAGAPLRRHDGKPHIGRLDGHLQQLAGAYGVLALGRECGLPAHTAEAVVGAAVSSGEVGARFLDELSRRLALGVAGVSVVLDPPLVVLGGGIARAGGEALSERVRREVPAIAPVSPRIAITAVPADPILHGALLAGLRVVREDLLASA